MNQKIRQALCDMGHDEAVIFDGPDFDDAIVGVTDEGRVIYDFNKMVQIAMDRGGIDMDTALDDICYNAIRALPYTDNAPIIMYPVEV